MYLFFDTETTGLPRNWNAPITDTDNWPRLVQIAWQLHGTDGTRIATEAHVVKPSGFIIPADSARVHGITTERALEEGIPLADVLKRFNAVIEKADTIVAHNISFDEKIVGAEFLRMAMSDPLPGKNKICTMTASVNYCAIDGVRGYKWPKLAELHHKLFGEGFAEAHNAEADINATAKCFWELAKLGVIEIAPQKAEQLRFFES